MHVLSCTLSRRTLLRGSALALIALPASAIGMPAQTGAHQAGPGFAYIEVPTYVQQRNLSCEYASAVIAMAAFGAWMSEWAFDEVVPLSANPHWGYRGDINGQWGNTTDYGIYAEALAPPLSTFGFWSETFYGQGDPWQLTASLDAGFPVIVWLGLWGDQSFLEYTSDGTPYRLVPGMHVVVAHGYDDSGVSVSDPAKGTYTTYAWSDFMWMWNVLGGMALSVGPSS